VIPTLLFIIIFFLVPLIVTALIVLSFIQTINNFQEVLAYGIQTEATIVDKYHRSGRPTNYWIVYEYLDTSDSIHRGKFTVLPSEYDRLQVGESIDIAYSARRPQISFRKELLDQSRAAQQNIIQSNRDLSD